MWCVRMPAVGQNLKPHVLHACLQPAAAGDQCTCMQANVLFRNKECARSAASGLTCLSLGACMQRLEQARQGNRCCPDDLAASTRPSLLSPAEQDAIATSPTSAPAPTTPQRLATSGSLSTAMPHPTTPKQAPGVVHVRLAPAGALSREHVHARTSDGSSSPLCSLLLPNMTSLSSGSLERSSLPLVLSSVHKGELHGAAAAPNDPMQHTSVSDVCPGESLSPPHRGSLKAALSKQAAAAPVVMLLGPLGQGQGRDSDRRGRGAKGQQCLVPADPIEGGKAAGNTAGDCMAAIAAAGKAAGGLPPCKAAMAAVPLARASDDLYCLTGETGSPLYMGECKCWEEEGDSEMAGVDRRGLLRWQEGVAGEVGKNSGVVG